MSNNTERPSLPSKSLPDFGGWGRFPVTNSSAVRPEKFNQLEPVGESTLARGLGRSYGDAALNTGGTLVLTERLNRFLEFDAETGVVRAEAGTSLKDLLDTLVPKGWFVPVTPGTKFCTLGGCIASDVHGKNHHRDGTFSDHVSEFKMVLADGSRVTVTRESEPELFFATAGGMGLTGITTEVTLQMIPVETAYMKVRHIKTKSLDQTVGILTDPAHDAKYSVAWMDCLASGQSLGRGVVMLGEHALKSDISLRIEDPLAVKVKRPKPFPFDFPSGALNSFTVKLFNALYYSYQGGRKEFISGYNEFFYPLDSINDWNRMYGKNGFVQYQYVMPMNTALEGTREILNELSKERKASFLAVLKRFGQQGPGYLSFPADGLTLAIDIPMSATLLPFLDHLDDIVMKYGGRVYLAKDSRMKQELLTTGYPRIEEFCKVKQAVDPNFRFNSDLARRLGLCQ